MTGDRLPGPPGLPSIREALAMHEALRRLGFPSEAIYLHLPDVSQVRVVLQHEGRTFAYDAGNRGELSRAEYARQWEEAAAWWNAEGSTAEKEAIYAGSGIYNQAVRLIRVLRQKGFSLPDRLRHSMRAGGMP